MKQPKHKYVALANNTRMDGFNTVVLILSTSVCCNMVQVDRFVKCMWECGAAMAQWLFA